MSLPSVNTHYSVNLNDICKFYFWQITLHLVEIISRIYPYSNLRHTIGLIFIVLSGHMPNWNNSTEI